MNALADFHFLTPAWLLALMPLALLLWLAWRSAAGSSAWRRIIDPRLLAALSVDGGDGVRRWPLALLALAWIIAVVALANPTFERAPVPAFRTDAARVVVLDLSRSMLAADLTPSRLERARYKVADILAADAEAQVGLVAFAGDAFTVAPLSDDAETIRNMLDALSPDLMPVQGSRPDLAIEQAQALLEQAGARGGEVVLLTDDAGDARARGAAEALRGAGHRLAVIGVGTEEGAPVPGVSRSDGPVVATLAPDALRDLAAAGGGRYARVSAGDTDLRAVLSDTGNRAAKLDDDPRQAEVWKELGPWITLALLPLGAAAFRRGWLLSIVIVAAPAMLMAPRPALAFGWDDLWQRRDQQAQQALVSGEHERARALADHPTRLGSALYRLGDYAAAAEAFAGGDSAVDHYNRGNALARAGELEQALDAYDDALQRAPGLTDAAYNRARVEEALRQQTEQQQQGDSDQEGDQGQQENAPHGQDSQAGQADSERGASDGQSEQPSGESGAQASSPSEAQDDASDHDQAGDQPGQQAQTSMSDDDQGQDSADDGGGAQSPTAAADPRRDEQAANAYRDEAAAAQADAESQDEDAPPLDATAAGGEELSPEEREARQAADQWLRRIPDDPAGLLRRKFLYQYQSRTDGDTEIRAGNPW